MWSPTHPALFACVDLAGRLDLWNLNNDTEVCTREIKGIVIHFGNCAYLFIYYLLKKAVDTSLGKFSYHLCNKPLKRKEWYQYFNYWQKGVSIKTSFTLAELHNIPLAIETCNYPSNGKTVNLHIYELVYFLGSHCQYVCRGGSSTEPCEMGSLWQRDCHWGLWRSGAGVRRRGGEMSSHILLWRFDYFCMESIVLKWQLMIWYSGVAEPFCCQSLFWHDAERIIRRLSAANLRA